MRTPVGGPCPVEVPLGLEHKPKVERTAAVTALVSPDEGCSGGVELTSLMQDDPEVRRGAPVAQAIGLREGLLGPRRVTARLADQTEMEGTVAIAPLRAAHVGDLGAGDVVMLMESDEPQMRGGARVPHRVGLEPEGLGTHDVAVLVQEE